MSQPQFDCGDWGTEATTAGDLAPYGDEQKEPPWCGSFAFPASCDDRRRPFARLAQNSSVAGPFFVSSMVNPTRTDAW